MRVNKKIMTIIGCCILIFAFVVIAIGNNNKTVTTGAGVPDSSSNKKIGWGIKRSNTNSQPDLGKENKKIIEASNNIAIGNPEKQIIYLTFDEGYEAGYTPKILDVLKENDVKATFFITGHYLNSKPELVERMIKEGHIVGNHTVNHYSMPDVTDEKLQEEISKLHTSVYEKFGYEMVYLRPPMGEFSQRTLDLTKKLGYTTVMWSFAYEDWDSNKQGREDYAKDMILKNLHNGEVMLLHATSKDNSEILDWIIKEIKGKGYEFKNLDQFEK